MQPGLLVEYYSHDTRNQHVGVVIPPPESLPLPPKGSVYVWSGKLDEDGEPIVFLFGLNDITELGTSKVRKADRLADSIPDQESTMPNGPTGANGLRTDWQSTGVLK